MEQDELTIEVRYRGSVVERWALPVHEGDVRGFVERVRDAFYAAREALRTSERPVGELRAERVRIAAMAERSRESRAARKHVAQRARGAFSAETMDWMRQREAARRAADEERRAPR
ncbi:MAG: hypothetical protein LC624_09770 [Halobacteriales archaeon]|nr:hypothetical protein [Halobacteriales archaeon]